MTKKLVNGFPSIKKIGSKKIKKRIILSVFFFFKFNNFFYN